MMRIQKYIYRCGAAFGLFAMVACSAEQFEEIDLTPGNTPIQLLGATTRTTGGNASLDAYKNLGLKLTSRINKNTASSGAAEYVNYFQNIGLTIETPDAAADKSKLNAANAYYPLASVPLLLYGHTGEIDENNKIALTSGKATPENPLTFDYLVSNGTNGLGTEGSSGITDGAVTHDTLMTFSHVMTKLEVAIDVTDTDLQVTKPTDIKIKFKDGLINKSGKYLITNATGDADLAMDLSTETGEGNYELSVGTHYLVPNGKTLSGKGIDTKTLLSSLQIDDYIATTEDLENIEIPKATPESSTTPTNDLILKPGLAYKLTFVIKRLKVVGVKLTVDNWIVATPQPDWGYDPYKMTLSVVGGYEAKEENNQITQVVLHHKVTTDGKDIDYQYVGKGSYTTNDAEKTDIEFLSIPKTLRDGLTIDVYTKHGLLVEGQHVTYTASTNKGNIELSLSANGMATEDKTYLVTTPLQFFNLLKSPMKNSAYRIIKNIDMDGLEIGKLPDFSTLQDFPEGSTIEGGTYTENSITRTYAILHLKRTNGGLFATNKGTIKNIYIFSGTIKGGSSAYVGGICTTNEGTIEGCVNEADIADAPQTAGGICGKNSGTILACLNTGNIQSGTTVGGICGENTNTNADAIKACVNTGMLNKTATSLGGICGTTTATSKIINTCYWLTGTARKDQGINNEIAIGSDSDNLYCTNASDLAPARLRDNEIMGALSTAATTWTFALKPTICAWPIPEAKP